MLKLYNHQSVNHGSLSKDEDPEDNVATCDSR